MKPVIIFLGCLLSLQSKNMVALAAPVRLARHQPSSLMPYGKLFYLLVPLLRHSVGVAIR